MTQIEKYIERLKTLQNLYAEGQSQHNAFGIAIVEANEMLVKNCSTPAVVGQREQLLAFKEWERDKCKLPWDAEPKEIVEQYLSQ